MKKYIQTGFNSKYPYEVEVWKNSEKDVPEWMSDRCKVRNITLYGDIILDTRKTNLGRIEYIEAGTNNIFLTADEKDAICFDQISSKIFSLTPSQLNILYKEKI